MNRLTAIGLASLVAYGLLIVTKVSGPTLTPAERNTAANGSSHSGDNASRPNSVSAQTSLGPRLSAMPLPVATVVRTTAPRAPTNAAQDFRNSRDLKAYVDALLARRTQLTADERFHLAKALESCLFANSVSEDLASYGTKQRRQFMAGIPQSDPNAAARIAAYDSADDVSRCLRFQGVKISPREIDDMYQASAQMGDARAQAKLIASEITKQLQSHARDENAPPPKLSAEDVAHIVSILETRDPEAILTIGSLLAQAPLNQQIRIGPNGEIPETSAFIGAWNLVACDLGLECTAQHRELQQACAFASYCGAGHFEEHYQTFMASPYVYQLAQRYRAMILTAMDSHDWSQIGLSPKTFPKAVASR
jgi:hypothetical protein